MRVLEKTWVKEDRPRDWIDFVKHEKTPRWRRKRRREGGWGGGEKTRVMIIIDSDARYTEFSRVWLGKDDEMIRRGWWWTLERGCMGLEMEEG